VRIHKNEHKMLRSIDRSTQCVRKYVRKCALHTHTHTHTHISTCLTCYFAHRPSFISDTNCCCKINHTAHITLHSQHIFFSYLVKYSPHRKKMFQMKVVDVKKIYSISCYALIPLYDEPLLRKSIISI
jgi:hypothetical protein